MLDRFYRWLARKLACYLRQEFQTLYPGLEAHPAPVPEVPEWERKEISIKTSPGVEYEICKIEKPTVFQCYFDCSNLLAVDAVLFRLDLRLREGDEFKPYFIFEFKGAPSPERIKRKIPKEVLFHIPETRSPAGLKLTIEQTAGLSRQLYCLYYARSPDV